MKYRLTIPVLLLALLGVCLHNVVPHEDVRTVDQLVHHTDDGLHHVDGGQSTLGLPAKDGVAAHPALLALLPLVLVLCHPLQASVPHAPSPTWLLPPPVPLCIRAGRAPPALV